MASARSKSSTDKNAIGISGTGAGAMNAAGLADHADDIGVRAAWRPTLAMGESLKPFHLPETAARSNPE